MLEDGITKIDGILYPSTAFTYQEMNLVLHPRAMHKLQFIDAMYIWMVHFAAQQQTQFNPLEQRIKADSNGNIPMEKIQIVNAQLKEA